MRDIKTIKQLCKSHIAGDINFERYRKERADILDNLGLPDQQMEEEATTLRNPKPPVIMGTPQKQRLKMSRFRMATYTLIGVSIFAVAALMVFYFLLV